MPITALPTPPSRVDSSTFVARSDAFLGALPGFGTEANSVQTVVSAKETEAIASAATASSSAVTAAANASTAGVHAGSALVNANATAASTNTPLWVSGTTYSAGRSVYSAITARTYRRITTGAGTTDPSADATNWKLLGLDVDTYLPAIRPTLSLDFVNALTVDPRITFTRASSATRTNQQGLLESVDLNVPRIDYDPITLACKGLLIEESRTNLLLNSTINGANLATQSVTVTAVAHTLSFYGTGTVTLSGAATGSLVGSGAYPTRSVLTFTPTAGSLTLTVTGTVQFSNLEVGSFATSYIVTAGSSVTRSADTASITGTNFSSWYRQTEGTLLLKASAHAVALPLNRAFVSVSNGSSTDFMAVGSREFSALFGVRTRVSSGTIVSFGSFGTTDLLSHTAALAYKSSDNAVTFDGLSAATDTSTVPTVNQLLFGGLTSTNTNCHIRSLRYYPTRLPNAQLQLLTSL